MYVTNDNQSNIYELSITKGEFLFSETELGIWRNGLAVKSALCISIGTRVHILEPQTKLNVVQYIARSPRAREMSASLTKENWELRFREVRGRPLSVFNT